MDNVPAAFHNKATDGKTPQALILLECDKERKFLGNLYLSSFGDISSDGATFTDEMTAGEDYVCGCVPSKTLRVSLMNENGFLNGHSYGWLNAYIGVLYASEEPVWQAGTYCEYEYDGGRVQGTEGLYSCRTNGFYRDGTRVRSGDCTGAILADEVTMYFFIKTSTDVFAYSYDMRTGAYKKAKKVTAAMCSNFSSGRMVVVTGLSQHDMTVIDNGLSETYYLASLGHFRVDRPKRTTGDIIDIQDAFDIVHELDVDAAPVLGGSSATNGRELMQEVLSYCGISPVYCNESVGSRFGGISVDVEDLMNNSYSCRKIVSYLCEAVGCNARWSQSEGGLYIYPPKYSATPKNYPITLGRIESNGIEVQDRETDAIDCISVKSLKNETIVYPSLGGNCVYDLNGNPFVTQATSMLFQRLSAIPVYTPMTVSVIEADPSFQSGDHIRVYLSYNEDENLATHSGVDITTSTGEEITVRASLGNYIVPLISQTIHWNGKTSAVYDIKGSADRSDASVDNYTDTNARTSKYISADYISAGTLTGVTINNGSGTFYVDAEGNLTATNADLSGEINATSGAISGDLALTGSLSMSGVTINNSGIHANNDFGDETAIEAQGMVFYNTLGGLRTRIGWIQGGQSNVEIHGEEYLYIDADTVLGIDSPDIRVNGHSSSVGTVVSDSLSSSVAVTANSVTPLCEVTLTTGLWLVFGYVKWAGVSSAVRRYINISGTAGAESARIRTDAYTEANAQFQMECSGYLSVTSTSYTYYLNAYTTVAGNALATYTQINAVRLL